jgi:YegS/Rv2252/BmrU family lipid kinase
MAGRSSAEAVRQALDRHFADMHVVYEVYETTGAEQVAEVVRAALRRDVDLVVAAGGDGTISDVAEALIGTAIPLGIIPVGTANVFARELEIPLELESACALLAGEHTTTNVDAMKVGDRFFVLQIGIGIDSLMIRDTERAAKRRFGRAAYVWTAFTRLIGYQPRRFTLAVDSQRSRPHAAQILIANGGVLGMAPFRWGPHIRPDDGWIDVCIVSARTVLDYLGVVWHLTLGQQRRDRNMRYLRAGRTIAISADRALPVQADGEIIGETPVQIQVVADALRVIVPAPMRPEHPESVGAELIAA